MMVGHPEGMHRLFAIALNRLHLLSPKHYEGWFERLATKTATLDSEKLTSENLQQLRADLEQVVRERFAVLQKQWLDFEVTNPDLEIVNDIRSFLIW